MDLKNIEWENVDLLLPETTRASNRNGRVPDLIKVGRRPVVIDAVKFYLSSRQSDSLMKMLKGENDFYYVRLPLSFRPAEGMELTLVSVELELQGADDQAEAWSMEPIKVEQEIKVGLEAKIGSDLKLAPAKWSSTIGSKEEYIAYQPIIEAFNLGRKDPAWEFRPSEGRHLSGIQLLHLVIRQPKGTTSKCQVDIRGDIEDRTGIFRFFGRIRREGGETFAFSCPGES